MASDMERIKAAFKVFDSDNSGKLSADELRAILSRGPNPVLAAEEIDEVINQFDTNGDGQLSVDEFAAACSQLDESEAAAVEEAVEAKINEDAAMLQTNPNGGNPFVMGG